MRIASRQTSLHWLLLLRIILLLLGAVTLLWRVSMTTPLLLGLLLLLNTILITSVLLLLRRCIVLLLLLLVHILLILRHIGFLNGWFKVVLAWLLRLRVIKRCGSSIHFSNLTLRAHRVVQARVTDVSTFLQLTEILSMQILIAH